MSWPSLRVDELKAPHRYSCVGGPFGSELTGRDYVDEGVPVIRGVNLPNDRQFSENDFVFVSEQKADQLNANLAHPGDLIFTQRGTLGQVGLIPKDATFLRYVISQSQMKLTVDPAKILAKYAFYYFRQKKMVELIVGRAITSGVPHINLGILKSLDVTVPPLDVQTAIVEHLDPYSDAIENNRRRIEILEQSARHVFKEWFVRLRYPGHEHDKVIDGVPSGWSRTSLGEIAITNSQSFSARSLPPEINYIDIASVQSGRILQKTRMSSEDAPGRARRRVRDGDVIWSNVRPNLRQYALILEPDDLDVVSTGFTTLTPKAIPYSFLYVAVTTDAFVAHLVNHTTGASYPAVRPEDFERAEVLVPTPALLDDYHFQCEPMFRLAHRLAAQNRKLAQARNLLLPRLMDGRIPV